MLSEVLELQPAFLNPHTDKPKLLQCVRVDGASDEGPSHDEVMFWWTIRHLENGNLVTSLSSRSSGSSYLNRVELQNGCLARNLFIPSTRNGTYFNEETGKVDQEKLRANLEAAMDVYISRVFCSPCGDTVIHLHKSADSSEYQGCRQDLQVFLKGSKNKKKEQLQKEKPALYAYFQKVWDVRQRHMVPGLPSQYLFLLVCCFSEGCPHPLCQSGQTHSEMTWFPGGPSVKWLGFLCLYLIQSVPGAA